MPADLSPREQAIELLEAELPWEPFSQRESAEAAVDALLAHPDVLAALAGQAVAVSPGADEEETDDAG